MVLYGTTVIFSLLFHLLPSNWKQGHNMPLTHSQPKSIGIIGAGSAGLAALKTALEVSSQDQLNWNIVLFEEREDVGGIWLPDVNPPVPPKLPETPLYPLLRTNTPVPAMTYPGFVFPSGTPLYPSHEYILKYHQAYATYYHLADHIRFNHKVIATEWRSHSGGFHRNTPQNGVLRDINGCWNVTFIDPNGKTKTESFHHLIVASGNHHIPKILHWPGEAEWVEQGAGRRRITHAIWYRDAEEFTNKTMLVVGAGSSGSDIARQVAPLASKIYVSARHPVDVITGTENVAEIARFTKEGIHLLDGSVLKGVDVVMLGTGYQIRKPFLERGGLLKVNPLAVSSSFRSTKYLTSNINYLFPLHKHIFPILDELPITALAFVGIPMGIANCPSDLAQSLYVIHMIKHSKHNILQEKATLLQELDEQEKKIARQGFNPYVLGHRLIPGTQSDYQDDLVQFLKQKRLIPENGRCYVEPWRRDVLGYDYLRRGWFRIEELGESEKWLAGVTTEAEWARLMKRIDEWQHNWEIRNNITFMADEFLV